MFNLFKKKPKFTEVLYNIKLLKTYKIGDVVLMDKNNGWKSFYKVVNIKNPEWGTKGQKLYTLKFYKSNRLKW